ncbi:MAG: tripartite tricarboxylate transporter substrate binding protein [Rhizobiales bacterium]|nr:tripartite tricarboxylate transporter substrate binding protein [Hyphomicrobiales bacterium]
MRSHCLVSAGIVIAATAIAAAPASAQVYPSKQIELVVPFVAGGTTDNIARMIAQRFTDSWSQTVIVSNRPGAGSSIGTTAVARAAPDGHTLLVTTFAFAANPALSKVSFDPIRDFAPVTELASLPMMLLVHPSVPAKNLKEFVALAKANPAGLDYASSGPGTSTHLAAEMFNTMAGIRLVHVPYKGNAEVYNALLGGHIKVHFSLVPSGIAHVRAGKLRVLAVTSQKRLPNLPDVPTIAESGFPTYEISSWQGVLAPAGTPPDVVEKINGELISLLKTPAMRERMAREGADPVGSSPKQFAKRVASEIDKWSKVAKAAGLATN